MCIERAHAAACMLQAAVKLLLLLLKGSWVAELEVQLVEGGVAESLWRHTWRLCRPGCHLCEFLMILTMSCGDQLLYEQVSNVNVLCFS